MPEELDEQICPDCGKNQGKKGSLTQWIGLGDSCRCGLKDDSPTEPKSDRWTKASRKCVRCLKQKPSTRQSLTQWLFRRDLCQCKDTEKKNHPIILSINSREELSLSNTEVKTLVTGSAIAVVIIGVAIICICFLDPNQSSRKSGLLEGDKRVLHFSNKNFSRQSVPFTSENLQLFKHQNFTTLRIYNSKISDEDLRRIAQISSLTSLTMTFCEGFSYEGMKYVAQKKNLNSLGVEGSKISGKMINEIGASYVSSLNLSYSDASELDIEKLAQSIATLQVIYLERDKRTDNLASKLARLGFHTSDTSFYRVPIIQE